MSYRKRIISVHFRLGFLPRVLCYPFLINGLIAIRIIHDNVLEQMMSLLLYGVFVSENSFKHINELI